jgi:hypothetical protein
MFVKQGAFELSQFHKRRRKKDENETAIYGGIA